MSRFPAVDATHATHGKNPKKNWNTLIFCNRPRCPRCPRKFKLEILSIFKNVFHFVKISCCPRYPRYPRKKPKKNWKTLIFSSRPRCPRCPRKFKLEILSIFKNVFDFVKISCCPRYPRYPRKKPKKKLEHFNFL